MPALFSKKYNFCFIHIPKTGGTTISKIIIKNIGEEGKRPPKYKPHIGAYEALVKVDHGHPTFLSISNILKEDFDPLLKFCVVRNPWDRTLSMWRHFLYAYNISPDEFTFKNFINKDLKKSLPLKLRAKAVSFFEDDSERKFKIRQINYLKNNEGNIDDIDLIIRFENLNNSIMDISKNIEHPLYDIFSDLNNSKIPHLKNSTKRFKKQANSLSKNNSYRDYYTAKMKKKVQKLCEEDIDIFKYKY